MLIAGVPVAVHANHGPATISTKVSTTSLRQTKGLQSGCSTARMGPTTTHLAAVVIAAAKAPTTARTTPERAAACQSPNVLDEPGSARKHGEPEGHS